MRGMAVAGAWGTPGWTQLHSVAQDAGLEARVVRAVTEQVAQAITLWPYYAEQAGVSAEKAAEVKTVLADHKEILTAGRKITVPPPQIAQAPEQSQSIPAPRQGPRMSM
jgi:phage tail protein X